MSKKSFFVLSLALNALLIAVVLLLLNRLSTTQNIATAKINASSVPTTNAPAPATTITPNTVSFRWSQLESSNYLTYIANLRAISCPEQTLHDIITADVDASFYASRRQQLKQQQLGGLLESSLQALAMEETAFIDQLLTGRRSTPQPEVAATILRAPKIRVKSFTEREAERSPSLPLVLQSVNPDTANLTEVQRQTINELREKFLEEIGTTQNPSDPAYRRRWQAAQREADDMLAGQLGRNFTLNYQTRAQQYQTTSQNELGE